MTWPLPPFLWGVATSAYQIEGGIIGNDWTDWEREPGKVRGGVCSGEACGSWEHWQRDLDRIQALGLNAYRFSIEWSRVEPEEGRFDEAALAHYRTILSGCRERGITPLLTLHHFTNPRWFLARGGWEERSNLAAFERYARLAGERFGDLVDLWITINEPEVYGFYAYDAGVFPPGIRDRVRALRVIANLLEAHGLASQALREADRVDADGDGRAALIGAAKHWVLLEARNPWSPVDQIAAVVQHGVFNVAVTRALTGGLIDLWIPGVPAIKRHVDALQGASDFLGVNYYTRWQVGMGGDGPMSARPGVPKSDLGWEILPDGLETALRSCAGFRVPLMVTENGIADAADRWRPDFIRASLAALDRARAAGVDVRGYFHWSLMDNYEWHEAYEGKFGLYARDAAGATGERPSAKVYTEEVARRR
ncbi:MAG TPA: family 1 glycosylhydrolase [Candidatus Eisenbacteria bacterium]|nr:family 1 glycosylhydrolase [Candidatus Eisenbacteria bacterium]